MLTNVLLASWPAPTLQEGRGGAGVTFSLASPLPYALDGADGRVVTDGSTTSFTNQGNAPLKPVMQAQGPTSGFTITDNDTGQVVTYDASRLGAIAIGGGHYAEIDFFKGSIYLDGDPTQDLIAGLVPGVTEFFSLVPGGTSVTVTGADVLVDFFNAWV